MEGKFNKKRTAWIDDSSECNGILQVFCIGFTDTLTMSIPLQVLKLMGADRIAVIFALIIIIY